MRLSVPVDRKVTMGLRCGQTVSLDGTVHTGRDEMHLRALEYHRGGREIPVDLEGGAVFHCGPIMVEDQGKWRLVAAGPTTSARMNSLEPDFILAFRPAAIIGKGGMSTPTVEAMKEVGCVYLALTGGAAVLAARGISEVKGVEWLDLGMPEALWILEAMELGPLIVAIDAHGNSLYDQVSDDVKRNLPSIREHLGLE